MRFEHDSGSSSPSSFGGSAFAHNQRAAAMHQWLARFAPLLESPDRLNRAECQRAVEQIQRLRADVVELATLPMLPAGAEQDELERTFRDAVGQLDGIENDLRRRIGVLMPGDPSGAVDLGALRARMAEAAARREVEQIAPTFQAGRTLTLDLPPGNRGSGLFMGIFSFGWLSFTTMHAALMISGMAASGLGWAALFLLGFYAIFFSVGIGMALGAANAFAQEQVEIADGRLIVRRSLGLWKRKKEYTLGPRSEAYVTTANFSQANQRQSSSTEIAVLTAEGTEARFGSGRPDGVQRNLVEQINDYLQAVRA